MKKPTLYEALAEVNTVTTQIVEQARAKAVEVEPSYAEAFQKQFEHTREWLAQHLEVSVSQDNPEILFLNTQDFFRMIAQFGGAGDTKAFVIPGTEVIFIHHNPKLISEDALQSYLHMANHEYLHLLQKTEHFSQPQSSKTPISFSLGINQKNLYFSEKNGGFLRKDSGLFLNEMLTESLNLVIRQENQEDDKKGTPLVDVGYRLYPLFFMQLIEALGDSPQDAQVLLNDLWKMTFTGDRLAYKNLIDMMRKYLQKIFSQEKYSYLSKEDKEKDIQNLVKEFFHIQLESERFASGRHFETLLRKWGLDEDKENEKNRIALFMHLHTNGNLPYEQKFLNGSVTIK